jgi:hypothetical protein
MRQHYCLCYATFFIVDIATMQSYYSIVGNNQAAGQARARLALITVSDTQVQQFSVALMMPPW